MAPVSALEPILWLEADRMKTLDFNPTTLKNQQDVVKEEIRVNVKNQPYGGFMWIDIGQQAFSKWENNHDGYGSFHDLENASLDDVRAFHRDYIRPDNVQILVAGDTTLAEITAELDRVFGNWDAAEMPIPKKSVADVDAQKTARVFLIDRPDSPQTLILTGALAPSTRTPNNLDIQTMNDVFGGNFTSRLNMNLREDKRWAYGASSFLQDAIGQRPFITYASVQTDKSAESVHEILKESRAIIGTRPVTDEELARAKAQSIRALPGSFETTRSVLGVLVGNALYTRADDYVTTLKAKYEAQTDADIEAAAPCFFPPKAVDCDEKTNPKRRRR